MSSSEYHTMICRWAPTFNTITYKGTKHERRAYSHQIMEGRFNVLLTTYEMILREKSVLSKVVFGSFFFNCNNEAIPKLIKLVYMY